MEEPLLFAACLWQSETFALHVLSQGAPSSCAAALYQAGTSAPARGRAGLSVSPTIWISPLAVGVGFKFI